MRRTHRVLSSTLTSLLCSLALVLSLAIALPTPARADAAGFQLNGSSFGPNATVMVEIGTLTRDCDFIETASTVYVVPTGTVGPGSALTDVSGTPNVITSFSLGGAIFDEVVAITGPSGTVGEGTYDIVEDTCQNGVFDGSDSILTNAFTVTFPSGVPPLPSAAVEAMKAGAAAQRAYWVVAAQYYTALFAAYTAYSLISDALDPQGFYLTYICAFLPSNPDPSIPITPYCPTVGIDLVIKLQLEVVKTIINKAAHYNGIAADPPDPNFAGPSVLDPAPAFSTPTGDPVEVALAEWAGVVGQDEVLAKAFLGALEKYQGAEQADDAAAALMHARALQQYAVVMQERQVRQSERLDAAFTAMAAAGFNPDAELAALRVDQAGIAAGGFDADEVRRLSNLGLDADAIAHLQQAVVQDIELDHPFADTTALFNGQVAANNQMGAALIDLANALSPIITDLETVVATSGTTAHPIVDAGGPYTGVAGSSITVTATCDTCTSVAWDLDSDGAFDDGAAASASVTLPAGSHLVGVRGVSAAGKQSADYAVVTVTTGNRAPVHSAETPATGAPVAAPIGTTTTFSVTASDPDADPVTTEWFDGGALVGSGPSHGYTAAADRPTALIRAVSTDPAGARTTSLWFVQATHPDADGDGWTTNIDCDDTNGAVNPGAAEVPGNGVDDDCNPATPDAGPPVAAFTYAPSPGIIGEPVTLTDASTDPEGQLAAWHWDVDADGNDDSTASTFTHTFASAGSHPVTLRVVDQQGLEATSTAPVVVTDRPVAAFTWAPAAPEAGQTVTFTSTSTDADGIAALEWDFDHDGVTFEVLSTEASPSRTLAGGATVALRVTDTLGAVSAVTSHDLAVSGPPAAAFNPRPSNGGTNVALAPHGASVAGFSSQTAGFTAAELLDVDYPSGLVGWRTATGSPTNQWVALDLARPYLIDRIKVQPAASTSLRPAQVTVGLGESGSAPGDVSTVVSTELANSAALQEFTLTRPTTGRHLRYDILTNRGGTSTGTDRLEAWTGQVGTAEVAFTDLSTDPDTDISSWQWDFGHDAATSSERNPVHTFPGTGDYTVTLTVTDASGATASTSLVQTVVGPTLAPTFTLPTNPREGVSGSFTDTTVPSGTAIVNRVWTWGDGGSQTSGPVTGSRAYSDNGTYDVTLTLTDTHGFVTSTTQPVTVANQAPTASAGPDRTWFVDESASFTSVSASDPGSADRPTLHCRLDYGDGVVLDLPGCPSAGLRAPHAFTDAGTYTVTLTVTDKDGGSATDTATHTVSKRPVYLSGQIVPGSARGGGVDVRAVVWDAVSWRRLPGATVVLDVDGHQVSAVTDATGEVAARLPWTGPAGTFTATVAETRDRLGATDSDAITTGGLPPGDVFFIVDESGSMGTYQAQMRANIAAMAEQLRTALDTQIGVAGLPGVDLFMKVPPTDNLDEAIAGANALGTSNGGEYGIDGIALASRPSTGWRQAAGKCLVLIGDEPAQRRAFTADQARQALADNGVVLYSIITIDSTTLDYQTLATGSGGAFFDINTFRTNPQPVLQALAENCAAAITERPDLDITVDNGRDSVDPDAAVEYTVTVGNSGLVDSTGVAASVTLPVGLTLVSASDGGTIVNGALVWPEFGLASGATATRTFTAHVDAAATGTLIVSAAVHDDGTNGDDLTPANNADADTDTVNAPLVQVVVTAEDKTVVVGAPLPAFTFGVTGLPTGVGLTTDPACSVDAGVDTSAPGTFPITCAGGVAPDGYVIVEYRPGTLTVEAPPNSAPQVDAGEPYAGTEGAPVTASGSATDPDGDPLALQWTVAPDAGVDPGAACSFADAAAASTSVTCTDDGTYLLTLTASDGINAPVASTVALVVANAAPLVGIASPADGSVVQAEQVVTLVAPWTDAGANDSHTYRVDFGDGTPTVNGAGIGGELQVDHAYGAPGTYGLTVEVTDDDGASGTATILLVVADQGAKVTGGGFITQGGRTSFGFVAQPDGAGFKGQLSLQVPGKHTFHGSTVDTMSASGRSVTWSGRGRWNGADGYTFRASVQDNGNGGKKSGDVFSIRVTAPNGGVVFERTGKLAGGNITVH